MDIVYLVLLAALVISTLGYLCLCDRLGDRR